MAAKEAEEIEEEKAAIQNLIADCVTKCAGECNDGGKAYSGASSNAPDTCGASAEDIASFTPDLFEEEKN